ncbi:MAG: electron transport complex subunit RsxC [Candidatus Omnitrophota bacterium]
MKKTFPGGIHPGCNKKLTENNPIETAPIPKKVAVPLTQGLGNPAKCLVKKGDDVLKGQLIGAADGFISSNVHASVSGTVSSVGPHINPVFGKTESVFIENDGKDKAADQLTSGADPDMLSGREIKEIVKAAGIVGLGGAAFPTHVKLIAAENKKVDALIINGIECEPFLTCDYRLMLEKTREILEGAELLARAVSPSKTYIAIEDNKPAAITAMKEALGAFGKKEFAGKTEIVTLKTKYPQGGEKQAIKAIMKREVPPGKLPLEIGCIVQNVGTACAVREAVYEGSPLIQRCVTVTGSCVKTPGNFNVRIGTLLSDIVNECCGGFSREPAKIIFGGPMMGIAQFSLDLPIIKGVSGVLFLTEDETAAAEEGPCIRCGRCVDVCSLNLVPTMIARCVKKNKAAELKSLNALDCLECGACAYICPARIPLVQYMKLAKNITRNICDT